MYQRLSGPRTQTTLAGFLEDQSDKTPNKQANKPGGRDLLRFLDRGPHLVTPLCPRSVVVLHILEPE
jgi:hypothetical protein